MVVREVAEVSVDGQEGASMRSAIVTALAGCTGVCGGVEGGIGVLGMCGRSFLPPSMRLQVAATFLFTHLKQGRPGPWATHLL